MTARRLRVSVSGEPIPALAQPESGDPQPEDTAAAARLSRFVTIAASLASRHANQGTRHGDGSSGHEYRTARRSGHSRSDARLPAWQLSAPP